MIVARVRRTIASRGLLRRGDEIVVACSGGPDSVALVHALSRLAEPLGVGLRVATVDHGLRSDVARELSVVEELARGLSLPFHLLRVDVPSGGSIQGGAREARYAALLDLAHREGASQVAVGHTQDDQAETVVDRLLRGASVRGLAGIAPKRADGVIRPLIDVRRSEVLEHLAHHGLEFIEDPSNQDPRYTRVRIRGQVLPTLAAEDPAIVRHLAALADDARDTRRLVEEAGGALLTAARRGAGLDAIALAEGDDAARREALRAFLEEATGAAPRRAHLEAVDRLVAEAHGPRGRREGEVRLAHPLVAHLVGNVLTVSARQDPGSGTK